MKIPNPLLTVIIINYNNGELIYQTLQSTLEQNYENMELIVSDDCSDCGFDPEQIINYINAHRGDNLKRVIINQNEVNMGTVRHLEHVRKLAHGDLELVIAADDVWYDNRVFSDLVERIEALGPDAEWLVSQMEMCDENLDKVERLFVPADVIRLIKNKNYEALLNKEVTDCFLPSSSCLYRRSFFEKITGLSEYYFLVEDYTSHIRALAMGIPVYYLDRISVKHRNGGISHGNVRNDNPLEAKLWHDFCKTFEVEIQPLAQRLNAESYDIAKARYANHKARYEGFQQREDSQGQDACLCAARTSNTASVLSFKTQCRLMLSRIKPALQTLSRVDAIKKTVLLLLCVLACAVLLRQSGWLEANLYGVIVLQIFTVLLFLFMAGQFAVSCALKLWEKRKSWREQGL